MKNVVRMAALAAALAVAAPAAAQQQEMQGRVGIGVGMPTEVFGGGFLSSVGGGAPQIYVPINVTPNLRIEPQIGFFSDDDDDFDETDSAFTLGVGVFYVKPVARQTQLYLGGRLALAWTKDEEHAGVDLVKTTQTNAMLAAVLGGEYLPSPSFSVGAEAQIDFIALGDPETEVAGGPTVEGQGGSIRSTQALVFVRVYFM